MNSPLFSTELARAAIATSQDSTVVRATDHTAERPKRYAREALNGRLSALLNSSRLSSARALDILIPGKVGE